MASSNESKLQRHARKFRECSSPGEVLERYRRKAPGMTASELQQHLCHVCAWIVLASPQSDGSRCVSASGLSPVRLLAMMLRLRGRQPVQARLRAALQAVSSCCSVAVQSQEHLRSEEVSDWQALQNQLPRLRKRKAVDANATAAADQTLPVAVLPDAHDSDAADITMFKRRKKLNDSMYRWTACGDAARKEFLLGTESRFRALSETAWQDLGALRSILYDLVAALAPPQAKPLSLQTGDASDVLPSEDATQSAPLQDGVRRMLVKALTKWRWDLWLEDCQIEPLLAHITNLLQQFKERHGDIALACAAKQWFQLLRVVGSDDTDVLKDQAGHSVAKARRHVERKRKVKEIATQTGGVFVPSDVIRSLPYVFQSSEVVDLVCSHCKAIVHASWLGRLKGKHRIICPQNGHSGCGKGSRLRPFGDIPFMTDSGGSLICQHNKRRDVCCLCRLERSAQKVTIRASLE
eukprot:TRINITY_DN17950_c0_g1_i1.p1 TRINITY_DN17950_c0_g1~~TRINITY_DN17950_c0_g1_i1.p1  ORF type:complete len:465 (+),score=58.69 TRINITY_DN17950_c0_g1_i1:28-1422(+)